MYIYYKIYKSMRRGRIHGEKNMRNSRTKTQTKLRNYIKLTAGALLLAITFVLVFAGTLSGAFGIESELHCYSCQRVQNAAIITLFAR